MDTTFVVVSRGDIPTNKYFVVASTNKMKKNQDRINGSLLFRCGLINDIKIIMLTDSPEMYSSTFGAQQGFFFFFFYK